MESEGSGTPALERPAFYALRPGGWVEGTQRLSDGTVRELSAGSIAAPLDAALRALSIAIPLLGAGAFAVRL